MLSPDTDAPLNQWKQAAAFKTLSDCDMEMDDTGHLKWIITDKDYRCQCIASDDPRLAK